MIDLRAERLNRGLSLQAAAEQIEVSRDTLVRAEDGSARPHARNAYKIARFYGYQVTDIWPVDSPEREEAAA